MTGEKILKEFIKRVSKLPKRDLSKKTDYYDFCERLSKATYSEMIAKDRLMAKSMALAAGKRFG